MTTRIPDCFYCKQPLSEKHYLHSKATGQYQVSWNGGISCKKCFFLTPAEMQKCNREAEKLAKRPRKLVPILTVPIKFKMVVAGKPIRSK